MNAGKWTPYTSYLTEHQLVQTAQNHKNLELVFSLTAQSLSQSGFVCFSWTLITSAGRCWNYTNCPWKAPFYIDGHSELAMLWLQALTTSQDVHWGTRAVWSSLIIVILTAPSRLYNWWASYGMLSFSKSDETNSSTSTDGPMVT